MNQGLATFPGVKQILSFHGTLQQGVTPSVFQLVIIPQETPIQLQGDLTITYNNTKIVLKDCCIDIGSYSLNKQGYVVSLNIRDRRWKWDFGEISGSYNQTDDA